MTIKKLHYLFLIFSILFFSACEKDSTSTTNPNTTEANKEGTFRGSFAFKDDFTDTLIQSYELNLTKTGNNKYKVLSTDGEFDIDIIDNNGTITLTDELKDLFTNFTGSLTNNAFTIQADGDDQGNLFQLGYNGIKTTNTTLGEEYFIFDNTIINCQPDLTTCETTQASYSYFYFGIYDNQNTGGALLIRTKVAPTPGTYNVVSYQKFSDEVLASDECIVIASNTQSSPNYYSTGTTGTLVVSQQNGKLVYQLSNVSVALGETYPELTISAAKGYCK